MKTSAIIRIAIYACIAVLLTGILAWGIRGDGLFGSIPINGIVIGGNNYMSYDDNNYSIGGGSIDAAGIDQVQVDWIAGNVNVRPTDGDQIVLTETSSKDLSEKYQVHWLVQDGTLKIKFAESRVHFTGIFKSLNKELTLEIPRDLALSVLDIETVSGGINAGAVTADTLDLETVSGNVNADGAAASDFKAETVSGAIKGSLSPSGNATMETVSGRIDLAFGLMPRNIKAETVSGAIALGLPENDGFRVDYDKVSGNFNCDFEVKLLKNAAIYKNGQNRIDLSSVSGNLNITML